MIPAADQRFEPPPWMVEYLRENDRGQALGLVPVSLCGRLSREESKYW